MAHADDATANEIPIRLTLGGTTLSISAFGQWELGTIMMIGFCYVAHIVDKINFNLVHTCVLL